MRAAAWLGDGAALADAMRVLGRNPGRVPAIMRREGEAALAALEGRRAEALAGFLDAARRMNDLGLIVHAALCELGLVTMLGSAAPEARAAAANARAVFERLGAEPLLKLLEAALHGEPARSGRHPSAADLTDDVRTPVG
jgi:hypothetical protein